MLVILCDASQNMYGHGRLAPGSCERQWHNSGGLMLSLITGAFCSSDFGTRSLLFWILEMNKGTANPRFFVSNTRRLDRARELAGRA